MADTYDTRDVADRAYGVPRDDLGGTLRVASNLIGAVVSFGLVAGVAVWGYKLLVRDVTGIPVVRAVEGPMRIQPEDPGGDAADHQGLAVNAVAADGSAAPPADRLVLAPRPVELTGEDQPRSDLAPVAATPREVAPQPNHSREIDDLIAQLVAPRDGAAGPIVAPAPLVIENTTSAPQSAASPVLAAPVTPAVIAADTPGPARSLRPRARPAASGIATAAVSGPDRVIAASAPIDIDVAPQDVPVGTRVVQFGAYDTPDIARAEWDRLNTRFGDYLAGKRRLIQEASSGGRTFYRLRALGFDDLSHARRFCSALVAEGADCIPVVTR